MKNKIICIVMSSLLILSFTSCKKTETKTVTTNSGEVSYTENMKDSVELPEGYPEKLLPLYNNAFIASAAKQTDGSFTIISFSDDSPEKVKSFYEDALKNASVVMKTEDDDSYVNMGTVENFQYTVTVAAYAGDEDYKTNINLVLVPGDMEMTEIENVEEPEKTKDSDEENTNITYPSEGIYKIEEGVDFPEDYPENILPIYTKGESVVLKVLQSEQISVIGYASTGTLEDVAAFYREKLTDTENLIINQDENGYSFTGTSDGITFTVYVLKNIPGTDVDEKYPTLLTIQYLDTP